MSNELKPMVSVITGFYNRGALLQRTVDSLLAQTYENLEIIVFDDRSTDDTSERLMRYEMMNDPRLRIIRHEKNKGFTQGMIDAIAEAKGEYIAVQGSGDSSEPTRIEKQAVVLINRPEVGVVGSHYENIIEAGGVVRLRRPNANKVTLESLRQQNVFTHGEVMYRKSAYELVGGYRTAFRYCQDYDLWLRIIRHYEFATVPEMLYKRYIQFDGVSYAPEKSVIQARYFLICQRMAALEKEGAKALFERLRAEGPLAIVGEKDPALQKRLFRNCLRQIVWGNRGQALELAQRLEFRNKTVIKIVAGLFGSKMMAIPRKFVFKALGIQVS